MLNLWLVGVMRTTRRCLCASTWPTFTGSPSLWKKVNSFVKSEAQYKTRDTLLHKNVKTHQSDHNENQNHQNSNCKIQSTREKQQNTSILSTADCKEVSHLDKHSRTGRSRLISGHTVRTRSREPSRIPLRKVVRLFKKSKSIRKSVRLYIRNYVPQSSKLKSLLCTYYRNYTFERQTNMLGKVKQKTVKSCNYGVHCYSNIVLNLCVVQTRTAN